jgi:rifampicin phosphotransferase
VTFAPPGPGRWTLDTGHFPRPVTRFLAELFTPPVVRGFGAATRPYGLLLDHMEWAFIEGWAYISPRRAGPLRHREVSERGEWDSLLESSPELRRRLATSERVFERRIWREELEAWQGQVKPAVMDANRRLAQVDPGTLAEEELLSHIVRCRRNLRRALYVHHRCNVTPAVAVGDFLAHAEDWTGRPAAAHLALLQGRGPRSVGAARELRELAEVLAEEPAARAALESDGGEAALSALRSLPGGLGGTVDDCLEVVGWWLAGASCDVDEPCLVELPEALVEALRAAMGRRREDTGQEVRSTVAPGRRAAFDELLGEARSVHHLRDERALYCDVWASGLARRGILAAGARLAEKGSLEHPANLLEADYGELHELLGARRGPSGDELAERARRRREADPAAVPVELGGPAPSPVPIAWLPPGAARTERAFRTFLGAMAEDAQAPAGDEVRGMPASSGVYQGRARVVGEAGRLAELEAGDVLVTAVTSPAFNVALPRVGAIVTDRGGMLSHAAIVAREYGIPAVVGTGDATRRIPEGAPVRVDGGSGVVTVLRS